MLHSTATTSGDSPPPPTRTNDRGQDAAVGGQGRSTLLSQAGSSSGLSVGTSFWASSVTPPDGVLGPDDTLETLSRDEACGLKRTHDLKQEEANIRSNLNEWKERHNAAVDALAALGPGDEGHARALERRLSVERSVRNLTSALALNEETQATHARAFVATLKKLERLQSGMPMHMRMRGGTAGSNDDDAEQAAAPAPAVAGPVAALMAAESGRAETPSPVPASGATAAALDALVDETTHQMQVSGGPEAPPMGTAPPAVAAAPVAARPAGQLNLLQMLAANRAQAASGEGSSGGGGGGQRVGEAFPAPPPPPPGPRTGDSSDEEEGEEEPTAEDRAFAVEKGSDVESSDESDSGEEGEEEGEEEEEEEGEDGIDTSHVDVTQGRQTRSRSGTAARAPQRYEPEAVQCADDDSGEEGEEGEGQGEEGPGEEGEDADYQQPASEHGDDDDDADDDAMAGSGEPSAPAAPAAPEPEPEPAAPEPEPVANQGPPLTQTTLHPNHMVR